VLVVLVAIALLAALLFDAGVEELRAARSELVRVRAASAMDGVLADVIGTAGDSALEAMPVGGSQRATFAAGNDSTDVSVQAIGRSLLRLTVVARVTAGRTRARQGTVAFVRLVADTTGGVRTIWMRPLASWWRSPLP
jgi:hypothetical protein